MKFFQPGWELIQSNKRAFKAFNIIYYGLVVIFMVAAAFAPEVQAQLLSSVGDAFSSGPLAMVGQAYGNAEIIKAVALTFVVNLVLASFLQMTLPSLVIPFIGVLLFLFRAILWGLLFSPINPDMRIVMIPHSITLILEGQAYILVMFAVYLQGRAFLWPKSAGVEGHGKGYVEGLKRTGKMYILITAVLLIAAIYEVIEVVLMARFMA